MARPYHQSRASQWARAPGHAGASGAVQGGEMSGEEGKQLVRRLVDEVVNRRDLDALDEIASGQLAQLARRWISPFRASFPDFTMRIVSLVTEGDTVVGHFACSGTHTGEWLGIAPTGRRFEGRGRDLRLHGRRRQARGGARGRGQPLAAAAARHPPSGVGKCAAGAAQAVRSRAGGPSRSSKRPSGASSLRSLRRWATSSHRRLRAAAVSPLSGSSSRCRP